MIGKAPGRRRTTLILAAPLSVALGLYLAVQSVPSEVQLAMLEGTPITDIREAKRAGVLLFLFQSYFLSVTFVFMLASWRALDENLRTVGALFSSIEDRTLSWLRFVMIVIFVAWVEAALQAPLANTGLIAEWGDAVDAGFMLVWISAIAFFGIRQRPALAEEAEAHEDFVLPEADAEKYARSALDRERMQKLAGRMEKLMRDDALYRDPTLSLRRLADRVGASTNHVSQTLNLHLGMNFFDFVNRFRVAEADRLLRDTERTATDIALDVGFNSRSTFNAAIRKHRGTSPTEARRQA